MSVALKKDRVSHAADKAVSVRVVEHGARIPKGSLRCELERNISFSTRSMESYFFADWDEAAYDALLVAAAVEFADKAKKRRAHYWPREFRLSVPVHDVARWSGARVHGALLDALNFLTGDRWEIEFYQRRRSAQVPEQGLLSLDRPVEAVIPYSNGLDSRAVAGLTTLSMGDGLVRVRLGSRLVDREALARERHAFTAVPFDVTAEKGTFVESTVRSRGFKFALVSGMAAYLAGAGQVIVPESGQGALGPSLVTVGQTYDDYRSHPLFTVRMEKFLEALLGHRVRYVFPQIWRTKGETLRQFIDACPDDAWASTWSCWQSQRQVSVDGRKRQCGVCAACMLRRMSIHAAGLVEPPERYVWERLTPRAFEDGAESSFRAKGRITGALREYAIAGALHLDHLAALADNVVHDRALGVAAFHTGGALGLTPVEARGRLDRLLRQHNSEWEAFMLALGPDSFVADWALQGRT
jgi:7-cyano-7-deazaguanine synthase in queuosine biosynthesis